MPYVAIEDNFPGYPKIRMATFAMCESLHSGVGCRRSGAVCSRSLFISTRLDMGLVPGALFWGMTADVIGRR
jgi:hypothetical protein